jgi:hypothetical protein
LTYVVILKTRADGARQALPDVLLVACVVVVFVTWLATLVWFGFWFI